MKKRFVSIIFFFSFLALGLHLGLRLGLPFVCYVSTKPIAFSSCITVTLQVIT